MRYVPARLRNLRGHLGPFLRQGLRKAAAFEPLHDLRVAGRLVGDGLQLAEAVGIQDTRELHAILPGNRVARLSGRLISAAGPYRLACSMF